MSDSDLAALSSIATQIDEVQRRVTAMAERYGITPDSSIAGDLFSVERALLTAGRAVQRAAQNIERVR